MLTHRSFSFYIFINTGIGAEVEKKRNSVVERERQKAIRSTEEVVRREEETKRLEVSCK